MKNPIYFLAYCAGCYKSPMGTVLKLLLITLAVLALVYFEMHVHDVTIEIKKSGEIIRIIK